MKRYLLAALLCFGYSGHNYKEKPVIVFSEKEIGFVQVGDMRNALCRTLEGVIINKGGGDLVDALLYSCVSQQRISGRILGMGFEAEAWYDDSGRLTEILGRGCSINVSYANGVPCFDVEADFLPVSVECVMDEGTFKVSMFGYLVARGS